MAHTNPHPETRASAPNLIEILENDGGALAMQVSQPPIAFHRVFVEVTGSVTAALLLSACIDQEQETPVKASADGWMPTSADLWLQRTALSVKEQATARRILRDLKLMEERLSGFPAQLAVRLNWMELSNRLVESSTALSKRLKESSQAKPVVVH